MSTTDEGTRESLHERLEPLVGRANAELLMKNVREGATDLATRSDLALLAAQIRAEMATGSAAVDTKFAELRTEMHAGFAGVDTKFGGVDTKFGGVDTKFAGVDTKFAELRTEMHAGFAGVDTKLAELRTEMHATISSGNRYLFLGVVSVMLANAAAITTAAHLH